MRRSSNKSDKSQPGSQYRRSSLDSDTSPVQRSSQTFAFPDSLPGSPDLSHPSTDPLGGSQVSTFDQEKTASPTAAFGRKSQNGSHGIVKEEGFSSPSHGDSPFSKPIPNFAQLSPTSNMARRGSEVAPDSRPGSVVQNGGDNLHLPMPSRPNFTSTNSHTALLGDESNGNTPATPYLEDPFDRSSLSDDGLAAPVETSRANGPAANLAPPPEITVSANTPEFSNSPTFDSRPSFSAPFASAHEITATPQNLTQRRSSVAPSALSSKPSYGAMQDTAAAQRVAAAAAASGLSAAAKNKIADRRSMRAKQVRSVRKDRESKEIKTGGAGAAAKRKPFESTRLKGEIYKPWLEKKDPAQRWAKYITIASIVIGIGLAGFLCYNGYAAVPNLGCIEQELFDDFNTLDTNVWQREVRLDGYGTGSFQWTTADDKNSFVEDGILYIVPTLTSDDIGEDKVFNGHTVNLTLDGTCTSTNVSQCAAVSNSSRLTVINPVKSARLITKNTHSIKYGKVEVKAKFPTGDWLWPSISMLPVEETYGAWPRSGQIDLLTGRGNNASYPNRGVDYAQSDLHWGPNSDLDRLYMTWGYREQRRQYYNQAWHTYGLEWNDKYMWTYIDSKISQVISLRFNKQSFWEKGKFPSTITNTTTGDVIKLINPWLASEQNSAPFDQPFYLVLDLAVGSTDGWFPDGEGGKPWLDNSGTAMSDFWLAKDRWWNNWSSDPKVRGFAIDSVKMWKTCGS